MVTANRFWSQIFGVAFSNKRWLQPILTDIRVVRPMTVGPGALLLGTFLDAVIAGC